MTKSELIDTVKRWQVAVYLFCDDEWPISTWNTSEFMRYTKTFLALLDQLEPDIHKLLLVKRGDLLPIDYSSFPILRITNPIPTDPGIGFCGVNYTKGDPEEK